MKVIIGIFFLLYVFFLSCTNYNVVSNDEIKIKNENIRKQKINYSIKYVVDNLYNSGMKKEIYAETYYNPNGTDKHWIIYKNNKRFYERFFKNLNNSDTVMQVKEKYIYGDTVCIMRNKYLKNKEIIFQYNKNGKLDFFVEHIFENNMNTKNFVYNADSILVSTVRNTYNNNNRILSSIKKDTIGNITEKLINEYHNNRLIDSKEYIKEKLVREKQYEYYKNGLLKNLKIVDLRKNEMYIEEIKYKNHLESEDDVLIVSDNKKDTLMHKTYYTTYFKYPPGRRIMK